MKTILTFLFAVAMVVFVNTANAGVPKPQPEQNVLMEVANDDIVCNSNIDYHCATINQNVFMETKNVEPALLDFYSSKFESPILKVAHTLEFTKAIAEASKAFFDSHKKCRDAFDLLKNPSFKGNFEKDYRQAMFRNINLVKNENLKLNEIYIALDFERPPRIS
jgi:hypothetical protein